MVSGFSRFLFRCTALPLFGLCQTFFSIRSAAASMTGLTFRADWGQMDTHRMQEIHKS